MPHDNQIEPRGTLLHLNLFRESFFGFIQPLIGGRELNSTRFWNNIQHKTFHKYYFNFELLTPLIKFGAKWI